MSDFNPQEPSAEPTRAIVASDLQHLLDRPIAFQRIFARVGGGPLAGLFLSQAVYWAQRTKNPDGWFYKTQTDWFLETDLTRRHQETARKHLRAQGILEEKLQGIPAQLYFRVNFEQLQKLIVDLLDGKSGVQTSRAESAKQGGRKAPPKQGASRPAIPPETTPQNSPQTSSVRAEEEEEQKLISDLVAQGVTKPQATKTAATHAAELRRRLEFLPFVEIRSTPARFLMGKLDEEYFPPTGYKNAEEAKKTKAAADLRESQRALADQATARRAAEVEEQNKMLDDLFESYDATAKAETIQAAERRAKIVGNQKKPTPTAILFARREILKRELGLPVDDE